MDSGRVVSVNLAVVRTDPFTHVKSGRSGIDKRPAADRCAWRSTASPPTPCATRRTTAVRSRPSTPTPSRTSTSGQTRGYRARGGRPAPDLPGNVGENLTTAGVDCSQAVIGERWQVGDAVLRVTGPRTPCRVFSGFLDVPDLIKRFFAAGRPGAYLAVEKPAAVSAGDPVTVLDRPAHGVTTAALLAATAGRRDLLPRIAEARDDLGPRGREWLDTVLAASRR